MRPFLAAVLLALLLGPAAANAQARRWGSFEMGAGTYVPNIDSQTNFKLPNPYERSFGKGNGWMFDVAVSRAILTWPGTLEVGFRTGYMRKSAKAFQLNGDGSISGIRSGDTTAFNVIPTSITVTYRLDMLADRYHVPLAPYVKFAVERYNWWISNTKGGSSRNGATNGLSGAVGLAFLLDILDRQAARELATESGIDHTFLFAELGKSWIDDFGSSSSWDLSNSGLPLSFGLMFVF